MMSSGTVSNRKHPGNSKWKQFPVGVPYGPLLPSTPGVSLSVCVCECMCMCVFIPVSIMSDPCFEREGQRGRNIKTAKDGKVEREVLGRGLCFWESVR